MAAVVRAVTLPEMEALVVDDVIDHMVGDFLGVQNGRYAHNPEHGAAEPHATKRAAPGP